MSDGGLASMSTHQLGRTEGGEGGGEEGEGEHEGVGRHLPAVLVPTGVLLGRWRVRRADGALRLVLHTVLDTVQL